MKLINSIRKYPKQWGIGFLVLIILGAIVQSLGYGSSDYASSILESDSSSVTTSSSKTSEKSSSVVAPGNIPPELFTEASPSKPSVGVKTTTTEGPLKIIDGRTKLQSLFILLATEWQQDTYEELSNVMSRIDLYSDFNQKHMNIANEIPSDLSIWGTSEDYIEIYFKGNYVGRTEKGDKMGSVEYYMHNIPLKVKVNFSGDIVLTDYNIPSNVGAGYATDYKFSNLDEVWQYINTTYPEAKFD